MYRLSDPNDATVTGSDQWVREIPHSGIRYKSYEYVVMCEDELVRVIATGYVGKTI